jgi:membrane protease YdiL (CAAX protease family)
MIAIPTKSHQVYLAAEFVVLFIGVPVVVKLGLLPFYPLILLWTVAAACLLIMLRDKNFNRLRLWQITGRKALNRICVRFAILAGLLAGCVAVFKPLLLFSLPRQQPLLWVIVIVLYPILSVYPQAIIYRAFLFYRYRILFGKWLGIAVSAAAFSYMHLIFENVLAVVLTLLGGVLFAKTYDETNSLVLSGIEHALYGTFIFTVGLGNYFYYGAVG